MNNFFKRGSFLIALFSIILFSCDKGDNDIISLLETMEEDVLTLVNQYRYGEGLSSLTESSVISVEAKKHSQNMADGAVPYGHDGFVERMAIIRAEIGGTDAAENIGLGQESAQEIVDDWINSSAHKANMDGDYTHTGVGIAEDSNGVKYFTQIFLKK